MAIGGFKAVKLRTTTNKSTQSGVIIAYAANAKDTLARVKDAIVGFGGWTWNNDLGFVSTTGYETDQYITYYTTLTHTNGAQLFISYGASGVQFHWSCFCQGAYMGGYTTYPTITENGTTYTMTNGGCWRAGLCMSMIPPGSPNHYGTPNRTDNSWMPSDATPLCGYLGTLTEAYKNAATVSTAARMTSGDEYIYIMAKEDLFIVVCHDPTWKGYTSASTPGNLSYYGYIVGRMFENLAEDDNQYYSTYGWLSNAVQARITNNSTNNVFGFNTVYTNNPTQPGYLFQMYDMPTGQTGIREYGGWGFFSKTGFRFNQYGPGGIGWCSPVTGRNYGIDSRFYNSPTKAPWYALEVGWRLINASDINSPSIQFVSDNSFIKGTVRTDLVRAYQIGPADGYQYRFPPYGAKLENGNFIMGPSSCAWGWNSEYTDAETEELCPWRQQSGFDYNNSTDFGGYNDVITSIASNGSKIFITGIDAGTKSVYVDSASTGGTTFDGAETAATSGWYPLTKLFYDTYRSNMMLSVVNSSNSQTFYVINSSTRVATAQGTTDTASGVTGLYTGDADNYRAAACYNPVTDCHVAAWTGWDSTGGNDIKVCIRIRSIANGSDVLFSTTSADSLTGLVQDCCCDKYGNTYIMHMNLGTWSGWSPSGRDKCMNVQKINTSGQFCTSDGTTSSDNTTLWVDDWGIGQAIVADNYGYIYLIYRSWGDDGVTQIGIADIGVKKMRPDGTIVWTKHFGVSGATVGQLRSVYTYDNKIHISGQIDVAWPGFSMTNTIDSFFATMTTDGCFKTYWQGGFINNSVINCMCPEGAYDYVGINELGNSSNVKPKYALLKRTW